MEVSSVSKLLTPSEFLSKAVLADTMAIDTETNGKDIRDGRGYAIGISAAVRIDNTYYSAYFPVAHESDNVEEETKNLLFQLIATRKRIIFHSAKFDIIALQTTGFNLQIVRWYCTMLMAHMLNENVPKGLDWLAKNELREPGKLKPPEWEFFFKIYGWSPKFPAKVMALYAAEDAVLCLKLFFHLYPIFVESGFDNGSEV
ncbi:hypothetical protein [Chitinophaga sp.]|uniref:hypothetical protein n=1 Tax=Chitinophaga sp. TaxID=1869181 RepID=UPI002F929FE1